MLDASALDARLLTVIRDQAVAVETGAVRPGWRTIGQKVDDAGIDALNPQAGRTHRRAYLESLARLIGMAVGEIRRVQALPAEASLDARKGGEDAA